MKNQKEITEKIRLLEEKLLSPATRRSAVELDRLLADGFTEFGRSGRVFDKQAVIGRIQKDDTDRMNLSDFKVVILAPDIILATYYATKMDPDGQKSYSLRSSIWRKTGDKWQMFFHQGTAAAAKP